MAACAVPFTACAVVVRLVPYGEADLVVHLFARGRGRLGAFARGARRSHKRFGSALEPFTIFDAELVERRGSDLLDLKSATIVEPNVALRAELGSLAHAGYATELVRELLREHEPNDPLFALLTGFLADLGRAGPRSVSLRAFELAVLGATGLAPVLSACAGCGRELDALPQVFFESALGGAACPGCARTRTLELDLAARRLLQALQSGGLAAAWKASEEGLPLEPVRRALRAFVDHHVRHDLRSLQFLRDVGAPP